MNAEILLQHFERISEAPDAIPRLRRFILDLAVRGKLVEQDPNDEPAAELLKRIIAKKAARNLKEKMKSQKYNLVLETAENRSPLPNGWKWTQLSELTAILNGRAYSKNELLDDGTPVLRVGNLFTSEHWYYSNLTLEDEKYCDAGDLLFSWSASFGPFIWPGPKVIYHYHIWKLSLHSQEDLDKHYLYRFLLHKTQEIKDAGHGVSMLHMTKEKMEKVFVPLPPLAEQLRIVAKVDELMALCDQLEAAKTEREQSRDRLVAASLHQLQDSNGFTPRHQDAKRDEKVEQENLGALAPWRESIFLQNLPRLTTRPAHIKQLRQTILNLAVRGKLVEQDPNDKPIESTLNEQDVDKEWPFGLPQSWKWRRIGELSDLVTDGEHATPTRIPEHQVPLVTAKNVRDGEMDYAMTDWVSFETAEKAWRRCRPIAGDILLVCVGATTGRLCVLREPKDMVLVRSVALIRPSNIADADYMALAIQSPFGQSQIWSSVKVSAQPCLYINRINSLAFPLPPLAEQHRIVAKVDELMTLCDQLETQLTTTEADSRRLLEAVLQEALAPVLEEAAA